MESPTKRQKTKHHYQKMGHSQKRNHLDVGMKGFLVTTNFRPSDSVRDIYRLLNEYNDKLNPKIEKKQEATKEDEDDDDITKQLEAQINQTKKESKEKSHNFLSVDSGSNNCIFIKTTVENHRELGIQIIKDTFEEKIKRSKNLLRFMPIEVVTKSYLKDIVDGSGPLLDKYFLKEPTEYSIVFNKRYNNDVSRDDVIKELANLVALKNKDNKVNLKFPKLSIIVEVIKGVCCLAVLPNFQEWKKYNLAELWANKTEENGSSGNGGEEAPADPEKIDETKKNGEEPEKTEDSGKTEEKSTNIDEVAGKTKEEPQKVPNSENPDSKLEEAEKMEVTGENS